MPLPGISKSSFSQKLFGERESPEIFYVSYSKVQLNMLHIWTADLIVLACSSMLMWHIDLVAQYLAVFFFCMIAFSGKHGCTISMPDSILELAVACQDGYLLWKQLPIF